MYILENEKYSFFFKLYIQYLCNKKKFDLKKKFRNPIYHKLKSLNNILVLFI